MIEKKIVGSVKVSAFEEGPVCMFEPKKRDAEVAFSRLYFDCAATTFLDESTIKLISTALERECNP